MATAFLAILAPKSFPVIDRWAVRAVYGHDSGDYHRSRVYADFTQELATRAAPHYPNALTVHALDQAVMNAAMAAAQKCDHAVRPCECLPFVPAAFPA
jgi:hypothetical protein